MNMVPAFLVTEIYVGGFQMHPIAREHPNAPMVAIAFQTATAANAGAHTGGQAPPALYLLQHARSYAPIMAHAVQPPQAANAYA